MIQQFFQFLNSLSLPVLFTFIILFSVAVSSSICLLEAWRDKWRLNSEIRYLDKKIELQGKIIARLKELLKKTAEKKRLFSQRNRSLQTELKELRLEKSRAIPRDVRAAMQSVVDYLYHDERKNYEEQRKKPATHIFLQVQKLFNFLKGRKHA